jgi:hypothetical protein
VDNCIDRRDKLVLQKFKFNLFLLIFSFLLMSKVTMICKTYYVKKKNEIMTQLIVYYSIKIKISILFQRNDFLC